MIGPYTLSIFYSDRTRDTYDAHLDESLAGNPVEIEREDRTEHIQRHNVRLVVSPSEDCELILQRFDSVCGKASLVKNDNGLTEAYCTLNLFPFFPVRVKKDDNQIIITGYWESEEFS